MAEPRTPVPDPVLEALRAEIDAADRRLLDVLASRHAIVRRIAAHKRAHGLPIRDRDREAKIIADCRARAEAMSLPPEVAESLLRTILAASRDLQASLRVGLEPSAEPRSVAIIGGRGGMGRLFERLLVDLGHTVSIADLDTPLTPEQAAANADVTIVSVPIDVTIDVVRRVGPCIGAGALLMDLTSIKSPPVRAMRECCRGTVIGAHPLFGPSVRTVQGQRIVLCPGWESDHGTPEKDRPGPQAEGWLEWTRRTFTATGMVVVESSPEEHDRIMSIVQVLTHLATEVTGAALASLDVPIERTLEFTSPVYQMELFMTARHFAQSPDLYAAIQMSNPATPAVVQAFLAAAEAHRVMLSAGDRDAFRTTFDRVRARLGPLTARALSESAFLIDRLIERM